MQDLLPWMAPWGVWSLYLLMFIAGSTLAWQGWFAHRLHDHPRCPKCAYDRTGLPSATCPECGYTIVRPWEPFTTRRRRYLLLLLGLVVAAALPGIAVHRRVRQYGWEYYRRVGPVYWMFPTQTLWSYQNGEYRVSCIQDRSGWGGPKLVITRGSNVVLDDERGDAVYLKDDPPPGTDLNGNGIPDVVVLLQSSGSGAYQDYVIVELGPEGAIILGRVATKGESTASANFVDVNGDGILEIDAYDWIYDGNESHPVPSMLLWDGNQFTRRPYYTCARPGGDW